MKRSRWLMNLGLALSLAAVPAVWAQQNPPHLAYVLPAGGRVGTTFEAKAGGQFLNNVSGVYVSGGGIQVKAGAYERPMSGTQATELRDKVQELQKKAATDPSVLQELNDIRVKLIVFNSNRNISPVLAETVTLQVTIAPDAALGRRELRLMTPQGLSNPVGFWVGQLPEFYETESISVTTAQGANPPLVSQPPTDMTITLPAVVNGRIKPHLARPGQTFTPGDADRYRFRVRRGQQLVVAVSARELIPYLADAVPGWFQAVLTLYDDKGNELAYVDDYRFHPDPVLHYEIPADGEYAIEIKDALYRGREDFVYRISLGELPFITDIFPLGGRSGTKTRVKLSGWNLPSNSMVIDVENKKPGVYPLRAHQGDFVSNAESFGVDALPEVLEKEPNDTRNNSQRIKLPVIINGRIDRPGDVDVFAFEGQAGEAVFAEVYARRLDSPLDSVLKLTDAQGRLMAFNDDHDDKGAGLETHHADSYLALKLPANGTYYLHLWDAQQKGGAEYGYRLRVSAPRPDFELRVAPSSINASGNTAVPFTVYALRKDEFSGDIEMALKDAPRGFILSGGLIPAGQSQARLTLTVPPQQLLEPLRLNLEGRATIGGTEVRREAVAVEDMMQAFAYRHLVPADMLNVAVRRGGAFRAPAEILTDRSLKIPAGEIASVRVRLQLPANTPFEKIRFELDEPPEGIVLQEAKEEQDESEIVLRSNAAKVKLGQRGNLIIRISAERKPAVVNGKPPANLPRVPLGVLPAIPFEIVQR